MILNPNSEHLFEFKFRPVEEIEPWGSSEDNSLSLSLFALTDAYFWISVGEEKLLRYSPEILAKWELQDKYANYQVIEFAHDIFDLTQAALSPIPPFFEKIVRNETLFRDLKTLSTHVAVIPSGVVAKLEVSKANSSYDEDRYNAFRWWGERNVWLNYFRLSPDICFVRIGDDVWIMWDNLNRMEDGINVWTALQAKYVISAEKFLAECHSFSERLLSAMESRITSIENGSARPKIPVDTKSLQKQLAAYKADFKKALSRPYSPDISWNKAEKAMRKLARNAGLALPRAS